MEGAGKTPALILKIMALKDGLSKSEQRVCDYIIENPTEVIHFSVSELAERSGVSDATVVRTCRKIGSSSYQDLKVTLAQDIVTPLQTINEEITSEDSTSQVLGKVFQSTLYTLNYTYEILNVSAVEQAVEALMSAQRIEVCGLGNSHAVANDIQHKFMRLGLPVTAYTDNHLQIMSAALLSPKDVLFAISHSGSSRDIVHCAKVAKKNGATVVSLTNIGRSPLYDLADIRLCTASSETRYRILALSSRLAQMTIVDAIYTLIALRKDGVIDGFHAIEKELGSTKY